MNNCEILLIEDNPFDAELALRALKPKLQFNNLLHLSDGEEALDFFNRAGRFASEPFMTPHLILLDLKLPKVTGIELLRVIKSNDLTKSIPTVALTSSKETSDIVECYRLGVNSYIVKPVDFDEFTETIGAVGNYWLHINQPIK